MSPSAFPIVAVREICNTRYGRDSLPQNIELFSLHLDPGVQGNAGEVAFGVAMLRTNPAATDGIIATIGIADACFMNSDIS